MSTIGDVLRLRDRWESLFWAKVAKSDTCWIWTAGTDKDGYGKFAVTLPRGSPTKQVHLRAHRVAWMLANGREFPADAVTLHSCDTPACVRPQHVSPGTQAENRADCGRKGRNATGEASGARKHPESRPRGDAHPNARLTSEAVTAIKAELRMGVGPYVLARRMGLPGPLVSGIKHGRCWRHIQ